MSIPEKQEERLMSEPEVRRASGDLSRSTRWRLIRRGEFPKPVLISKNRVAWLGSEIQEWIQRRVAASREVQR